jgi:ATP-dependent DNA helicase RecQ
MADQKRRLDGLGIPCALFRGGQDSAERRAAEALVERGEAKIVIANPECLAQERLLRFLAAAHPSHLAIDEAHCVSEWGETFRPSYLELGRIVDALSPPALSAFTATASPVVLEAVARILFGGSGYRLVEGDPDRPNLHYAVERSLCPERTLLRLAVSLPRPLVVFCASREGTQILARLLRERLTGCDARFYHAGLDRSEKRVLEEWFFSSPDGILVATCAYGMGVDKKDIRSVVHYGPPRSVEAYLQEAGRAGRDSSPAWAVLIVPARDWSGATSADGGERDERYRAFLGYAESASGCRRERLLALLCANGGKTEENEGLRSNPCSGCDRCDGTAREDPEGAAEITAFVAANPRRFDAAAATLMLAGKSSRESPPRCAGWGSMREWDTGEITAALRSAITTGLVRERRIRPWKGRLESNTDPVMDFLRFTRPSPRPRPTRDAERTPSAREARVMTRAEPVA